MRDIKKSDIIINNYIMFEFMYVIIGVWYIESANLLQFPTVSVGVTYSLTYFHNIGTSSTHTQRLLCIV